MRKFRLIRLLYQGRRQVSLVWKLIQDRRVPLWQKAIPFLPLVYILSPFNILSSGIPVIGQLDDLTLLLLAFEFMERMVDDRIVAEHKPDIIEAERD